MKIPFNNVWIYNDIFEDLPKGETVRIPHTVSVTPYNYFDESVKTALGRNLFNLDLQMN